MDIATKPILKNKLGQYFTPKVIAEFMVGLANINDDAEILEPSSGKGVFLDVLQKNGINKITAFEIDGELIQDNHNKIVRNESFIASNLSQKFDLIIGNPPYIRWKNLESELKQELLENHLWNKYFNSLCDYLYIFILKSIELLKENGQLIFICPEYWMSTTHSITLRNYMVENGYFEEIYHFNETPIFDKVNVSIVIFKFVKSKNTTKKIKVVKYFNQQKLTSSILQSFRNFEKLAGVKYLEVAQFVKNNRWILQDEKTLSELKVFENYCVGSNNKSAISVFNEELVNINTIGDFCDIGNGFVSGLDIAFQYPYANLNQLEKSSLLNVAKAKDIVPYKALVYTKYIYINEVKTENELLINYPNFYQHLQQYKSQLLNRYQYQKLFNYWQWVFLRNINLFNQNEKRIFVPSKERISNKNYFRFALADSAVYPTQDVTAIFKKPKTQESLEYILAYLNNPKIFNWLKHNGIVKGNIIEFSEKPIASIPFRAINWQNEKEVNIHNQITLLTNEYIENNKNNIDKINFLFNTLLKKI